MQQCSQELEISSSDSRLGNAPIADACTLAAAYLVFWHGVIDLAVE